MKIMVRILAEAQAPISNTELIKIEDSFTLHMAKEIVRRLWLYSPYDRNMTGLPQKSFSAKGGEYRASWTESRMRKNQHLKDSWAYLSGSMGKKTIYNRMPYSHFLAKGTGIYGPKGSRIYPTEKKALSFYYSYVKRWVVTRSVKGISPVRFKKMVDRAQYEGTVIGARRAMAEMERTWRGTLQTKLISQ